MPTIPITLIKGNKISIETDYRDALPVNMYAVERPILGAQGYMLSYPGLTSYTTGSGIDRGAVYNDRFGIQFRISGTKLISISPLGVVTELGTVPGGSQSRLEGFYSFNTQAIVANEKMFLYDVTDGFREVIDVDLGNPLDGVWIDGYYFLTDGEYIYHTDLDDESAVDPLKFATAEFMPDPSIGLGVTQDNKVMVFGRYTVEYFDNTANANFAFTRIETRAQKIGIVATHAKCESKTGWYITGGRKTDSISIHLLSSGISTKVSTREIDKILAEYAEPDLSDMRMECRMEYNVTFVLVHLPNETLCFNETIAKKFGIELAWSFLKSDVQSNLFYRAINGVFDARIGRWVYGDKNDTSIGLLDNSVCTQYGDIVEWLLYTPLLNLETMSLDELELEIIPGHTVINDATVALSITYDGAAYGTEWWDLYGEPLDYTKRFIIRRLGYVPDWIGFKFRGVSASKMAFALMKVTYS